MLPTFLIAGAPKSGSTTLWEFLKSHPQVCMAPMKEVNFFITGVWWSRYDKGIDWYSNLFQEREGIKAYGEASINYLVREESASLIHAHIPKVTLIFILRDPVDRIYSQYWYERQEGTELPDFETFVRQRPDLLREWIKGGRYDLHLDRFLNFFPKPQIQILLFDDLRKDPHALCRILYQAVGVDGSFQPPDLRQRANPTQQVRSSWLQRQIVRIEKLAYPIRFPPVVQGPLHRLRLSLRKANKSATTIPPIQPEFRAELLKEFEETIQYLERMLDRPLPAWRYPPEFEYNSPA